MVRHVPRSRAILACLGDSSRFRLVLELMRRDLCVSELAREVGLSQSCTTRHLQYLQREGLVCGARDGKRVVFSVCSDQARVRELLSWMAESPSGARGPSVAAGRSGSSRLASGPRAGRAGGKRARAESRRRRGARPTDPVDRAPETPDPRRSPAPETRATTSAGDPPARRRDDMEDWLL